MVAAPLEAVARRPRAMLARSALFAVSAMVLMVWLPARLAFVQGVQRRPLQLSPARGDCDASSPRTVLFIGYGRKNFQETIRTENQINGPSVPVPKLRTPQSDKIILLRPRVPGFHDESRGARTNYLMGPTKLGMGTQKRNFLDKVKEGASVSEVFYRFEGHTPWKKIGEVTHDKADFEEAVVTQMPLLVDTIYYLQKKARFFLVKMQPQFAYADEEARLVPVPNVQFPEATYATQLNKALVRCGFYPDMKPEEYWPLNEVRKKYMDHTLHRNRPNMDPFIRSFKTTLQYWTMVSPKDNPMTWKGSYGYMLRGHFQKAAKHRGISVGTVVLPPPSRSSKLHFVGKRYVKPKPYVWAPPRGFRAPSGQDMPRNPPMPQTHIRLPGQPTAKRPNMYQKDTRSTMYR